MQFVKSSSLGWIIPCLLLTLLVHSNSLGQLTSDSLKLKGKFELAFTPRWYGVRDYKVSPTDSGYYYSTSWYRFQGGMEIAKAQYIHLLVDVYRTRTDLDYVDKYIHSVGFGLQYSIKFTDCRVELKPFRLYKKPIHIRWYPELYATVGAMNLANESFRLSGLHQTETFYPFFQYGLGWNFYLEDWLHLSLLYFQEYFPKQKHDPYRFLPMQLKIVFKI